MASRFLETSRNQDSIKFQELQTCIIITIVISNIIVIVSGRLYFFYRLKLFFRRSVKPKARKLSVIYRQRF